MKLTVEELQQMMDNNRRKKSVIKILKKQGFKDVRRIREMKGIDAQKVAIACEKCTTIELDNYELYGALGEYEGFEWVWLEETRLNPMKFDVTILARSIMH